jgi:7,8-dihydropterin-6-yl-methyl-4-(beta-D-ribofuranosyl)aminobenzene 5'-phosphate synthase
MLFGPCAQDAAVSFLPATSSLCADGVGFVTAMMATLAANARTAPAIKLGRTVPEVDRLAVHMVTDNIVIQFVPSETRDGLTIERYTRGNLAPDRPPRNALNGEWGLAMYAESQRDDETRHVLIDFG